MTRGRSPIKVESVLDGGLNAVPDLFNSLPAEEATQSAHSMEVPQVPVFDLKQIDAALAECQVGGADEETTRKLSRILRRVRAHGQFRPRAPVPLQWTEQLRHIQGEFPNFRRVIEQAIVPHLALLEAGARNSRMAPVLLVGPPGVGKSYFARRVAEAIFAAPLICVDMASAQSNSELAGSSTFWSNSAPGVIFKALGYGVEGGPPTCDPIAILEEVDKCSADRYDLIAPLYALLERFSAKHFKDECVPAVSFNASLLRWFLTANDASRIPAAVRSRTQLFQIDLPTSGQRREVARAQMRRLVRELELPFLFDSMLPEAVVEHATRLSPREVGIGLEIAIGNAVLAKRQRIQTEDWCFQSSESWHHKIGFC